MTLDSFSLAIASLVVMGIVTTANLAIVVRGALREEITSRERWVVLVLTAVLIVCAYGGLLPWARKG
jgi:hypothetical protein